MTLDDPPLNLIGLSEVRELMAALEQIEADPQVQVVASGAGPDGAFEPRTGTPSTFVGDETSLCGSSPFLLGLSLID